MGNLIIDYDNAIGMQLRAPSYYNLSVDESLIHPKQHDAHSSRS